MSFISKMEAKNFAISNAGMTAIVLDGTGVPAIQISGRYIAPSSAEYTPPKVIIIGYCDDSIVVSFDDLKYRKHCYSAANFTFVVPGYERGWRLNVKDFEIINDEPKNIVPVYNNSCPKCKSPALVRAKLVFCSNVKCKMASNIRKKYYTKSLKQYILCPICKKPGSNVANWSSSINNRVYCQNNHVWDHTILLGDTLAISLRLDPTWKDYPDYVWDGTKFTDEESYKRKLEMKKYI